MERADPSEVMGTIAERMAAKRIPLENNGWTLRQGVEIVINPPFKCPHCYEYTANKHDMSNYMYPTNRIWMLDEKNKRLIGCWEMDGTEVRDDSYGTIQSVVHPHVGGTGNLCMGTASTVKQLLFMGMSKGNHYRCAEIAILNMGHLCPYIEKKDCKICNRKFYQPMQRVYGSVGLCSFTCCTVAVGLICQMCGERLEEGRPTHYGEYCSSCFDRLAARCGRPECGNKRWGSQLRYCGSARYYCEICVADTSITIRCICCGQQFPINQIDRNGECQGCKLVHCNSCYSLRRYKDLTDNLCNNCTPPRFDCRCGNKIRNEGGHCFQCYTCWNCSIYIGRAGQGLPNYCRNCSPGDWTNIPEIEIVNETEDQRDMDQGSGRDGILRLSFLAQRPEWNDSG